MERNRLVLLVEDDETDQMVIRRAVARCRVPVDLMIVNDGRHALEFLSEHTNRTPDFIITDWHMPRMGGGELLEAILELGLEGTPLAVLLGTIRQPALPEGIRCHFLEKSFDMRETGDAVCKLLEDVFAPQP